MEVYQYLEPLYNDYRRIRLRTAEGHFTLTHVDELVDEMLRNEYLFDIALPRVPNRSLSCSPKSKHDTVPSALSTLLTVCILGRLYGNIDLCVDVCSFSVICEPLCKMHSAAMGAHEAAMPGNCWLALLHTSKRFDIDISLMSPQAHSSLDSTAPRQKFSAYSSSPIHCK